LGGLLETAHHLMAMRVVMLGDRERNRSAAKRLLNVDGG
jgi:hypothetical protein